MLRYHVTFSGRPIGSLGLSRQCQRTVEIEETYATDAIVMKLYDTHEHVSNVRVLPAEIAEAIAGPVTNGG